MSPELETLDQLLGGQLPLSIVRNFFGNENRFRLGILAMLDAGVVALIDPEGTELPRNEWPVRLERLDSSGLKITDRGIRQIG